jgi:hypothetical protein
VVRGFDRANSRELSRKGYDVGDGTSDIIGLLDALEASSLMLK